MPTVALAVAVAAFLPFASAHSYLSCSKWTGAADWDASQCTGWPRKHRDWGDNGFSTFGTSDFLTVS
jgi:hypothetical protein